MRSNLQKALITGITGQDGSCLIGHPGRFSRWTDFHLLTQAEA